MSRKVVMQRDPDEIGYFSLAVFQALRLEALDLFDRSLAEGKPEILERFLERQIAQEAPSLELLSQVAEDVHQRLLALRQRHFDVREQDAQQVTASLHADVMLAEQLYLYVVDWLLALHIVTVRDGWANASVDENALVH